MAGGNKDCCFSPNDIAVLVPMTLSFAFSLDAPIPFELAL